MVMLVVVVLVAEEALAVPVFSSADATRMDGESCAEAAKGGDEGDPRIILTARSNDTNARALLLPVLLSVFSTPT